MKSPNPTVPTGTIGAVSCTTSDSCEAVGYYPQSSGIATLAEGWNGTTWSLQTTSDPTGRGDSVFEAVSCSTSDACEAVGYHFSSNDQVALAEGWNGTSWSSQTIPGPVGGTDVVLDAVSCTSTDACEAVGYDSDSSGDQVVLAEGWNGTSWSVQTTPVPVGSLGSEFNAVSCSAADACEGVGEYSDSSGDQVVLAEGWNGTSWSVQTTPNLTGSLTSSLNAVSCTAADECEAVGAYPDSSGDEVALAEGWNGTAWSLQAPPNPTGATLTTLNAVSCTAADSCEAVGYTGAATFAEGWNGTAWSVQTTVNPAGGAYFSFAGVSCTASNSCEAAFAYADSSGNQVALAEGWNGTAWSVQPTPNPTGYSGSLLDAVSCPTTDACEAVGVSGYDLDHIPSTLAEGWNGKKWKVQSTPNPTGPANASLDAVSCTASNWCEAVGDYANSNSGGQATLAELWNGKKWSIQTTPNPTQPAYLTAVSCTASNSCEAVGDRTNSSGVQVTLAEAWNGTSWSVQTTPNSARATNSSLSAVSCTASNSCEAVGNYDNRSGVEVTLAEVWNGSAWSVQTTPNPTGKTGSALHAVSCSAVDNCEAVGGSLAEAWNGTDWSLQTTPKRTASLSGVSCNAVDSCSAVGSYFTSRNFQVTLAEAWNGIDWVVQTTPNPKDSGGDVLDAVSCQAALSCYAVGGDYNSSGNNVTLVEGGTPAS